LFLQAGAVAGDGALDRFGQVVPQVPPVGDLDCQRSPLGGAFGMGLPPRSRQITSTPEWASSQVRNDSAERSGRISTGRPAWMSISTVP
jgi:hypothetical protein